MRRLWFWIPLFLAFAAAIGFNLTLTPETPVVPARVRPATSSPAVAADAAPSREAPSALAAELNAPDGTIERDLLVVDSVLEAFRTNFPGVGNPVGENNEITAVLTGRNRFGLELIPRGHPAINDRGELVDRWGTPLFFHQLSGDVMEIRSAGPDKAMHTEDDAVLAEGG
jgi:hypothetical protein